MYAFIEGEVCEKTNGSLVLLAVGVGWQISCSMTTLQAAPALGQTMRCYTFLSVREDAMELFGFATKEEKEMFLQLTSVSGIGPKTALGVLGSMPLRDLSLAILMGDVNALSRAPGIGKKTAQRIALELKDKITQADVSAAADSGSAGGTAAVLPVTDSVMEAVEALTALGYSSSEARGAIAKVKDQSDRPEELIRLALRSMAGM
ncbi:MAG: Holliday junction branch migration protein RuvA [Clostridia bacterium]|nr:Holliday junction branch migration protein RuvA [Clostridia bacterium]